MTFEFETLDGKERMELDSIIGRAPPIGKEINWHGKRWVRVPSVPAEPKVKKDCHFVSHSLPRNYKHHKGEFDASGRPLFNSWKEQRDTLARSQHNERHGFVYE